MKKIDYIITALVIMTIVAAIYFRFTYQPQINIAVNISTPTGEIFPFSFVSLPIQINNIGNSNVKNMGLEVLVNGNVSTEYSLTVPSGKSTTIYFNFTPQESGSYNITAIADSANLYSIINRKTARSSAQIEIAQPNALNAYAPINSNGLVFAEGTNLTTYGSLLAIYFAKNYTMQQLNYADLNLPYTLFTSLISTTYRYISRIGTAYGNYTNGSTIYSMWIQGSINENAVESALQAVNASYQEKQIGGINVTFSQLGKNLTLCSWYSGGWIKNIVYENGQDNASCISFIGKNYSNPLPSETSFKDIASFSPENTIFLGELDSYNFQEGLPFAAKILAYNNAIIIPAISKNIGSNICYGIISNVTNKSYCSTFMFPVSNKIGKWGLVRTSTYINQYNISLFSYLNQTYVISAVPANINLTEQFDINGTSIKFINGFSNMCSLQNFNCNKLKFSNGEIHFVLENPMNKTVKINSLNCFIEKGIATKENITLAPYGSTNVTATCYMNGTAIGEEPLGLHVGLLLNYSINNQSETSFGNAIINFFS
ncbi:MAG: CARDB domain-containing protein [Candidatus Micrarchaeia archaeon]